jgi:Ca2+-binding EF-hand superfamily protein
MEAIHTTKNTTIHSVAHDEDVLREEVSVFFKLWPKLSTWSPTTTLSGTDEKLARFAAEYGHPTVAKFLTDQRFKGKTLKEFLHFASGSSMEVGDDKQTMLEIAAASKFPGVKTWAQSYGTLRPRKDCDVFYHIIGLKVHGSETCIVIFAENVQTKDRVALKLMANEDEWQREKRMRVIDDGQETLDRSHVVEILDDFELDDEAVNFCASHKELNAASMPVPEELRRLKAVLSANIPFTALELESKLKTYDKDKDGTIHHREFTKFMKHLASEITDQQVAELITHLDPNRTNTVNYKKFAQLCGRYPYRFMITMPAAAMDLTYLLSHDRVTGNDLAGVVDIMRQIGEHAMYMHETLGRIHGDLKPRPHHTSLLVLHLHVWMRV